MKKQLVYIVIFISIVVFLYLVFASIYESKKTSKDSDINGKDISKEEYIYKEDLMLIGYTNDEVSKIQKKLKNIDVKNYLLTTKYEHLVEFIDSPYFNTSNIIRYEEYLKKHENYSKDQIVLYVEIGLDNAFYTNIKTIDNYTDINVLVNKYNVLPNDVVYNDLIIVAKPYSKDGKKLIRQVVFDDLKRMIDDAGKDNIELFVVSAYRSFNEQNNLFNNSKKQNGINHALMYSAKPGHSEHQVGLAVDLNSVQNGFENTKQYAWLKQNAYKYGFIERYPKGKEQITGFAFEPWHYRYLGVEVATKIFEENITYEEYLIKYKK